MNSEQNILLQFRDDKLEEEFRSAQDKGLRSLLRAAMYQSLAMWFGGLCLTYYLIPQHFSHIALVVLFAMDLPVALMLFSTYRKNFIGHFHSLATFDNALHGFMVIYVCHFYPGGQNIAMMVLVLVVYFGSHAYNLRFLSGSAVTFLYIAAFQLYILYVIDISDTQVVMLSFVAWLTLSVSTLIRYKSESNIRRSFVQEKTILLQKSVIQSEKDAKKELLLNILPASVVQELETTGQSMPRQFENVTILFTDFKGFTELVASIPVITLISELNDIFSHFDDIMDQVEMEKIETIGDAYLAACGIPTPTQDHGVKCIMAAKKMLAYLDERNNSYEIKWNMRVGIHSGPVAAGVVGKRKFRYDVFGDTVNTAARMESNSEPGRINISASTYELVKEKYSCTHRGKVFAKGKGDIDMYFVE